MNTQQLQRISDASEDRIALVSAQAMTVASGAIVAWGAATGRWSALTFLVSLAVSLCLWWVDWRFALTVGRSRGYVGRRRATRVALTCPCGDSFDASGYRARDAARMVAWWRTLHRNHESRNQDRGDVTE